jgi:hypothetical protein
MNDSLDNVYFSSSHPGGFGGPHRLARYGKVSQKTATEYLKKQDTYTKHKAVRHKFPRRKIFSPDIDYLWQADLVTIQKPMVNGGMHYLLTVIDVLSRFAFVKPLKNKQAASTAEALNEIFKESRRKPKFLQTDQGLEFAGKCLQFLKSENVVLFHNHSELKAAMVERFNRTLMLRISKFLTYEKTNRFIDNLQDFVNSYNNAVHRIIRQTPASVNKFNAMDVWMKTYGKGEMENVKLKPKLKEGTFVRCKIVKPGFSKGYTMTFTNEIFRVRKVVNSKPITYLLSNPNGDDIGGVFYDAEFSEVKI